MLNASRFKEILDRQQASGLSVKDFCFNEGISKSNFYYWRRKLQKQRSPKNFIPLVIDSSRSGNSRCVKGTQPAQTTGEYFEDNLYLEIVFPNGTKLRLKNNLEISLLKSLICLYP